MKRLIIVLAFIPIIGFSQVKVDVTYRVLESTYIALNIVDYGLTIHGLNNGALEANPIAKNMNAYTMAGFKLVGTAAGVILGRLAYKENPKAAKATMLTMNVVMGLVVTNNISVVISLNRK